MLIEIQHRLRDLVIDLQPFPDGGLRIILPLNQFHALVVAVAIPWILRGIENQTIYRTTLGARSSSGNPLDDYFVGHCQVQDAVERLAAPFAELLEALGLFQRARKPIQDVPMRTVRAIQPVFNEAARQVVGRQLSCCQEWAYPLADFGVPAQVVPVYLTGGYLRCPVCR